MVDKRLCFRQFGGKIKDTCYQNIAKRKINYTVKFFCNNKKSAREEFVKQCLLPFSHPVGRTTVQESQKILNSVFSPVTIPACKFGHSCGFVYVENPAQSQLHFRWKGSTDTAKVWHLKWHFRPLMCIFTYLCCSTRFVLLCTLRSISVIYTVLQSCSIQEGK